VKSSQSLRSLLSRKQLLVAPCAYDALSAKIIENAGFEVMGISGYGVAAGTLAKPDVGFTTLTQVVEVARNIVAAVKVPVYCDADTGYGNAINVMHTIETFIYAGVAGVHLEDQVFPKRCGHVAGKQVISMEEAAGKLRAADRIRREMDPDFVLIARTDALGAMGGGLEETVRRGNAYIEAGADIIFPDGIHSEELLLQCIEQIDGPIMYNMVGLAPLIPLPRLQEMGVTLVCDAGGAFRSAARAMWDYMQAFKAEGTAFLQAYNEAHAEHPTQNFHGFIGFPRVREMETEFLPSEDTQRKYAESVGYQP